MGRSQLAIVVVLASCGLSRADPCQVARLVTPDTFEPNSFGIGVASSGDYWFVSDHQAEIFCSGFGCGVGAVYVYEMVEGELVYSQSLVSPLAQSPDNFGRAVDAADGLLVVGAPFSGITGRSDRPGAVFVYEMASGVWELSSIIEPPLGAGRFGFNVAIHGGTVAVADYDNERVLVYEQDGGEWVLVGEIDPPREVSPDSSFGVAMDMDSNRVIVGASRDRSRIVAGGSFHVYRKLTAGGYEVEQSEYSAEQQLLGAAVAIGGEELFVGANAAARQFEEQGVVHRYMLNGSRWDKIDELVSEQAEFRQGFGATLGLDDGSLAITANRERAIYVFQHEPIDEWKQTFHLSADTTTFANGFGFSLALQGSNLLVGADDESDTPGSTVYGAAYHFDLACNDCAPDLDADGTLTIFDFLAFLNLFQDGDPIADFDGDGELTIFDFLAYQTAFDAGC